MGVILSIKFWNFENETEDAFMFPGISKKSGVDADTKNTEIS